MRGAFARERPDRKVEAIDPVMTNAGQQKVQETAARLAGKLGPAEARTFANDKIKDAILQRDAEKMAFWRDVLDEIKL